MTDHLETLRQFVHEIETAPTKVYPTMRLDRLEHVVAALATLVLELSPLIVPMPKPVGPFDNDPVLAGYDLDKPLPIEQHARTIAKGRKWFKGKDG